MKSKKFLFGIVVVLLMVTSVLPGCNNGEQPVKADKLVISSSLEPEEVFIEIANAGPQIKTLPFLQEVWSAKHIDPYGMPEGASEEQFIDGCAAALSELFYIKRDGKRAGYELLKLVSNIITLRYEGTESAERSFVNISEAQEFQDLTYGGIALKNGTHTLFDWEQPEPEMWDESTMPCYVIHSGCFVIYFYGREDVTKDMLDRIIVSFGVKEQNVMKYKFLMCE